MATATRTKNDYIFEHPQSRCLFLRLRDENGRRFVRSLGTSDRLQAEIIASPLIAEHKARILAARPRLESVWVHKLEPGRIHADPDGGTIAATDRELIHYGHNGSEIRKEPNGGHGLQLISSGPLTLRGLAEAFINSDAEALGGRSVRPARPTRSTDDAILETYLKHAKVTGYFADEARAVWAVYQAKTDGLPLKDAKRDDGRKVAAHFEAQGLKSATIQKKIMWLSAACNLAIKDDKLKFNPFTGVVGKSDDSATRLPLNDADIKGCKRHLGKLGESDQLLVRLLASTGMRLSEAFEIDGEEPKEKGHRFIIVGKKTKQSERRVPLPAAMLPHLPATIKGKLFDGTPAAASKRLMKFLRRRDGVGITDPLKVVHSLRHRAQDRLRAAGCPEDMRWAILGHEEETVAAGYGEGFPVTMLRKWIDKIGF